MTILLTSILVLVLFLGRQLYGQFLNPISIFPGIQIIALLFLFGSDFINRNLIDSKTYAIYLVSIICYLLGTLLSFIYKSKREGVVSNYNQKALRLHDLELYQGWISFLGIILLVSSLMYWGLLIRLYGVNDFFHNMLFYKSSDSSLSMPNSVLYLKMVSVFLSPFTLCYIVSFKRYSIKNYLVLALTYVCNIGYTRNVLVYLIILDLAVLAYSRNKGKERLPIRKVLYLVAFISFFSFFNYTQSSFNKVLGFEGSVFGNSINSAWVTIISYLSGPLVSTSLYFDIIHNTPVLGHTFRNLINMFSGFIPNIDTTVYQPTQFVYIPFSFNTATLQYYIFSEGGWLWTVLFFIILGFFNDYIFSLYKSTRSISSLMLLSFLTLLSVLSIREYILVRLDMLIYLLLLVLFWLKETGRFKRFSFTFRLR